MDKTSIGKFQFRLPQSLVDEFKIACENSEVKPSEQLRKLMQDHINSSNNNILNKEPYSFPDKKQETGTTFFTIGEMYCGPGGLGVASKKAGLKIHGKRYSFQHVWATDNHLDSCMTYQQNIPNKKEKNFKVICKDISPSLVEALPPVDGFLYGFPCNDFSNVGETKGLQGKYGSLYRYGVEYISRNNPKFIFAENVSGLSGANSGYAFKKIFEELSNAGENGYEITPHLYKFEEYGVPQARHRYILVGFRRDLGLKFKIPKPNYKENFQSCYKAISNPEIKDDALNHELTVQSKNVVERLNYIKPGENAWTADLPEHLKLNVKGAKLSMIYKRLDPDKPAYTITGSGGGGTHVYHWKEPRALTNRERARLQTFPDHFRFHGSKESVRRQIGMAVPVEGAKIILEAILKTFAGKSYPMVEQNKDFESSFIFK